MRITSVLAEDKTEIGADFFEPYRIVSMSELLEIYAEPLLRIYGSLLLVGRVTDEMLREDEKGPKKSEEEIGRAVARFDKIESDVVALQATLFHMGLICSANAALRFLRRPKIEDPRQALISHKFLLDHLIFSIRDDLEDRRFMVIPHDKTQYYDDPTHFFSVETREAFSSADEEMTEACKCFALNRHTACVFHLMRLMERCLQEWAQAVGFTIESTYDKQWQTIINDIRGKLKALYPSDKDPLRIKEENHLGHLETVKIAWRNSTMHPKQTYTEEQAKEIMDATKAFVRSFVEASRKECSK